MPRVRDVPCSGNCGKLIWRGRGCLPPGQSMCQECRRARREAPRPCPQCGSEYLPMAGGDTYRRRVCSPDCGQAVRLRGRNLAYPPAPLPTCEVCGAEYRRTYQDQRTCGRTCGAELQAVNRGWNFIAIPAAPLVVLDLVCCAECEKLFLSNGVGGRLTCSRTCARARQRRQDLARIGTTPEEVDNRRCWRCPELLGDSGRRLCVTCAKVSKRESMKTARRRRRARERNAYTEPYTLAEIAKRDKYRCGICRKRVAMTKAVPHPKAPTIDHLIPLSENGDDVPANVQLAHFWCNSVRGTGGTVQLLLVG
jgi:hypothetical protein